MWYVLDVYNVCVYVCVSAVCVHVCGMCMSVCILDVVLCMYMSVCVRCGMC